MALRAVIIAAGFAAIDHQRHKSLVTVIADVGQNAAELCHAVAIDARAPLYDGGLNPDPPKAPDITQWLKYGAIIAVAAALQALRNNSARNR